MFHFLKKENSRIVRLTKYTALGFIRIFMILKFDSVKKKKKEQKLKMSIFLWSY